MDHSSHDSDVISYGSFGIGANLKKIGFSGHAQGFCVVCGGSCQLRFFIFLLLYFDNCHRACLALRGCIYRHILSSSNCNVCLGMVTFCHHEISACRRWCHSKPASVIRDFIQPVAVAGDGYTVCNASQGFRSSSVHTVPPENEGTESSMKGFVVVSTCRLTPGWVPCGLLAKVRAGSAILFAHAVESRFWALNYKLEAFLSVWWACPFCAELMCSGLSLYPFPNLIDPTP